MRGRKFDLIGDYTLRRKFPWRLTIRRLQPGPARQPVDLTGLSARFEVYDADAAWIVRAGVGAIVSKPARQAKPPRQIKGAKNG
ncbi:MAG: hypothetical protein LBL48_04835 [Azoarcus sp.]|jgi:hypothetical protein|nr:hypothetical protein [Azoarcus sp.]